MNLKIVTDKEFRTFEEEQGAKVQYTIVYYSSVSIDAIRLPSIVDQEVLTCPTLIKRALEKYDEHQKTVLKNFVAKEAKKWF